MNTSSSRVLVSLRCRPLSLRECERYLYQVGALALLMICKAVVSRTFRIALKPLIALALVVSTGRAGFEHVPFQTSNVQCMDTRNCQ